ncbi:DUF5348 domain-containing protein [Algicola sagamiensis]|uniref:DUF5348 domain-containing protein n=1 Tax=Algicola sagamiensis TaxID=163869 RepID=UPI0003625494|nr:DUF5348 domain-containing protein [Algicola sagamiensis]
MTRKARSKNAFINAVGRIECNGTEFHSGDVVEVFIEGQWRQTQIEYCHQIKGYFTTDDYKLVGNPVQPVPAWVRF